MRKWQLCITIIIVLFFPSSSFSQELKLRAAFCETVINAGSTVSGAVETEFVPPMGIAIMSNLPGVTDQIKWSKPIEFSIALPLDIRPGPYAIWSIARFGTQIKKSEDCTVWVERSDQPTDLKVISEMYFRFIGDAIPMTVIGMFNRKIVPLQDSKELEIVASDSSVVKVLNGQTAVAVGPGQAEIRVTYKGMSKVVRVALRYSSVRGDLTADGHVDRYDIDVMRNGLNQNTSVPNDSRDLNSDGRIDALDLRLLTTMCSKPRCVPR